MASDYLLNKLAAVIDEADTVSLHVGDPGADGTANELAGGAPAYARVAIASWAAHPTLAGHRVATLANQFNVPADVSIVWAGLWNGGQWLDKAPALIDTLDQDTLTINQLVFSVFNVLELEG